MSTRKKASAASTSRSQSRASSAAIPSWRSRLLRFVLRWSWRLGLLALGFAVGLGGPAWYLLEKDVVARFSARRTDQPSRVYARALELYPGAPVGLAQLERELQFADYREGGSGQPGRYERVAGGLRIHTRPFDFADGGQAALRLEVSLDQQRVGSLKQLGGTGRELALARIDPAEIASIYPLSGEDRINTALAAFPGLLVSTVQAVEDRSFKHHPGVDWRGLARAFWVNLLQGRLSQGGSTITQQLIKNLYLSPERSLWRKLNESLMALALERHFDKGAILEAYLNEVFLGQNGAHPVHGFARAADEYFGVPVQSLSPSQTALLVGMVKGPSWYSPRRHPERALARRNQVLEIMQETGLISTAQLQQGKAQPLGVQSSPQKVRQGRYPAFIDLVRRQLRRDYQDKDLSQAGLRILTSLDPYAQEQAERALSQGLTAAGSGADQLQGAVVLISAQTGDVSAVVGDRQPRRWGYNRALDASRQIGSIMKPLVYLLALDEPGKFTLSTAVDDSPVSVPLQDGQNWRPSNYDNRSHGQVPLLTALVESYNQATVRIGLQVGVTRVLELLQRLGIREEIPAHPAALLGAVELSPFQVAQAYQALAADGYYSPLSAVSAVLNAQGQALGRYPTSKTPLRERRSVTLLNYALSRTSVEGTARSLPKLLGRPLRLAGKTGTTNDRRDAWFVGYTAEWLGVVWVGRDDNQPAAITGASHALPVWAKLFQGLAASDLQFSTPEDVAWYWVDWPRHELADEDCEQARAVPYLLGSEPGEWSSCIGGVRSFFRNL